MAKEEKKSKSFQVQADDLINFRQLSVGMDSQGEVGLTACEDRQVVCKTAHMFILSFYIFLSPFLLSSLPPPILSLYLQNKIEASLLQATGNVPQIKEDVSESKLSKVLMCISTCEPISYSLVRLT